MNKGSLEAFTDAIVAIAATIMLGNGDVSIKISLS